MKHSPSQPSGPWSPRSRRRIVAAASLAMLGLALRSYEAVLPAARAAPPSPSASADLALPPPGIPLSSYTWPTESSPEPKEEEWAGATVLLTAFPVGISPVGIEAWSSVKCTQRALREWMRVVCGPRQDQEGTFFGALWGLSGDIGSVSCRFALASELDRYRAAPTDIVVRLIRGMGASATLTFQVRPGSAFLLRLDRIYWSDGYEGSNVLTAPGILIDVSWALGEKSPTVGYH